MYVQILMRMKKKWTENIKMAAGKVKQKKANRNCARYKINRDEDLPIRKCKTKCVSLHALYSDGDHDIDLVKQQIILLLNFL